MAKPKPSPWSWINLGLSLVALVATIVVGLFAFRVIDLSPAPAHVPAPTAQPAPLDLPAKLITAGYRFDKEREDEGMNARPRRPVHSQWWTRSNAPQMIVISDDVSPTAGDFKINSIIYDGTDGKGHLTCLPKDSTSTALPALLADAAAIQESLNDNSKPGKYSTSLVTCLR